MLCPGGADRSDVRNGVHPSKTAWSGAAGTVTGSTIFWTPSVQGINCLASSVLVLVLSQTSRLTGAPEVEEPAESVTSTRYWPGLTTHSKPSAT
jgi:hypothetical protein